MGFLSPYQGNVQIDMGGGYWVEVKKFLTRSEADRAREVLIATRDKNGEVVLDGNGRLFEEVVMSIIAWNLTDENDAPLPYDHDPELERTSGLPSPRRRSLEKLPDIAYGKISEVVGGNNNIDPEQETSFRTGDPGDAEDGVDETSDAGEVPAGAEVVDDAGVAVGPDPDRGPPVDRGGGVSDDHLGSVEPAEEVDSDAAEAEAGETVRV